MVTRVHYFRRYSERDKEKKREKGDRGRKINFQTRKKETEKREQRSISYHWMSSSFFFFIFLFYVALNKRENGKFPPFVFLFLSWLFFPYQFTYFSLCRSSIDVPYFANTFNSHPPSFLLTE